MLLWILKVRWRWIFSRIWINNQIIGHGSGNSLLKYGRIRTLPWIYTFGSCQKPNICEQDGWCRCAYSIWKGHMQDDLRNNGVDYVFIEEHYTSYWETLLMMGVVIPLFLRIKIKKTSPLLSLERRQCYGIKDQDILERRVFKI